MLNSNKNIMKITIVRFSGKLCLLCGFLLVLYRQCKVELIVSGFEILCQSSSVVKFSLLRRNVFLDDRNDELTGHGWAEFTAIIGNTNFIAKLLFLFTCNMEDVLSIKIVSVDHYNYFPIRKLDTTYSEFRQSAVKQVPVIRIFGITSSPRRKVCANVHGVFPYFYVPCSERNPEKLQQLSKDLAAALDKSINISLGQSSSAAHHVYQISLVKGVLVGNLQVDFKEL